MSLNIHPVPLLKDNYAYVIVCPQTGRVGVIDPSESEGVIAFLKNKGLKLDYIFNTHHHWDHTNGNLDLKAEFQAKIVGFQEDAHRIPGIDVLLNDGSEFKFGNQKAEIIHVPGHTLGHIAFYFQDERVLFTGDTLFSLGCGRIFEGTLKQMHDSLTKLLSLDDETKIYCGHEYTLSNCKFALSLTPDDETLKNIFENLMQKSNNQTPSIPSTVSFEKQYNPFLKIMNQTYREQIGLGDKTTLEAFAIIRELKDNF